MSIKHVRNWTVLVIVLYGLFEGLSLFSLLILERFRNVSFSPADSLSDNQRDIITNLLDRQPDYTIFNPVLGWTIRPNGSGRLYRANSQGMRADRDYQMAPPPAVLRISTFGDSYTHCHDVKNQDTWQEKLGKLIPNSEVLNFGVGAYGLDQAFLRYRKDGIQFNSHIVLVGYMSRDIYRNVNVFRPFLIPDASLPLTKPRFTIVNNRLVLLPNPMSEVSQYEDLLVTPRETLPRVGTHDHFYHNVRYESGAFDFLPSVRLVKILKSVFNRRYRNNIISKGYYNEASEAFQVTRRILDEFHSAAVDNGSLPITVIFPGRDDITRHLKDGTKEYSPLLDYLDLQGRLYVDLIGAFDGAGKDYEVGDLFVGHYSPLANQLVASYIHQYLRDRSLTELNTIRDSLSELKAHRGN